MELTTYFDEMHGIDGEKTRPAYQLYSDWYKSEDVSRLRRKQKESERLFRLTGITFNVYGNEKAEERLIPFDIVPRILSGRDNAQDTKRSASGRGGICDEDITPFPRAQGAFYWRAIWELAAH